MKRINREPSRPNGGGSISGILLILISIFVWLLIDTMVSLVPATNIELKGSHSISSARLRDSVPGVENEHLWWILQISDIHISSYRNFHIPDNLVMFLREVVPAVSPFAIVATGDLTDAKLANILHSNQELSEWQKYRQVLDQYLINGGNQHIPWIDVRGNHDHFDVPIRQEDFYSRFSPAANRWEADKRHTVYKFNVNGSAYAIVAIDATPSPGFRRPYNFFGVLQETTLDEFKATDKQLANEGVQLALWAGHYPASIIFVGGTVSSQKRLFSGNVIRHGAAYLCGHLHTVHDAEFAMYARHAPLGQLELELADFQRSERFRVLAVDHGMVSFTDVHLNKWPIVIITNPKDALFTMPNYEPLDKIAKSTHIRILVFSSVPISSVQVSIDNHYIGNASQNMENRALFTLPWSPNLLSAATSFFHKLDVIAIDEKKRRAEESIVFYVNQKAFEELPTNIGGPFASLILLSNVPKLCRNGFLGSTLFCLILLVTARYFPSILVKFFPYRGFIEFAQLPGHLFFFFASAIIYPVVGPWFFGEMVSGRFGLVFGHGIILVDDGTFIPDAVVSFQGFINVMTFYFPLLLYFAWVFNSPQLLRYKVTRIFQRLCFQFLILWQLLAAYWDAQSYGWPAFIFNPLRAWISLGFIYLDYRARHYIGRF